MRRLEGQSAMEFLATYSYALLIISIALTVLILYFTLPKTILPTQCNFYSGFVCSDAALVANSAGGVSLIIVGIDNEPGIINASGFNAVMNNANSVGGFCLPSRVTAGQYLYCEANFTFNPSLSNLYYGTFNISANYCTPKPGNLSTARCPGTSNFVFGGSIRLQPQAQSALTNTINALIANAPFTLYYAPITITNNQLAASGSPLQVMLSFPTTVYGSYIHPKWNNVEFSTLPGSGGALLEAWVENAPSNTATNTIVWVDLPQGIQAGASSTIYVNFLPTNIMSSNGPTGEAPQLPSAGNYAQYDNGAYVFNFYYNYTGTSVPSGLAVASDGAAGSVTVNNGVTVAATSATGHNGEFLYINAVLYPSSYVIEGLVTAGTTDVHDKLIGWDEAIPTTQGSASWWGWDNGAAAGYHNPAEVVTVSSDSQYASSSSGASALVGNVVSVLWGSSALVTGLYGYASSQTSSTSVPTLKNSYPVLGFASNGGSVTYQWSRIRGYPPNGVMPTVAYGSIAKAT